MIETTISVVDSKTLLAIFGPRDQYLRKIRSALGVDISVRDDHIHIEGDEDSVRKATGIFEQLKALANRQASVGADEVTRIISTVTGNGALAEQRPIEVLQAGRQVRPRTAGQAIYVQSIIDHDLVFCTGPAGTGKTYLAVAMAVSALKQCQMRKIVLVRPAVEAGESLGYLPGDLQAKLNPYLRPLMDALREMMDFEQVKKLMERDVIEVIP